MSDRQPITETTACYRHGDRNAAVGCQRCGRPVCAECMHQASVGFHCPECTKAGSQRIYRPGGTISPPIVTYVLMALCGVAYAAQVASDGRVTEDGLLFGPFVANGEWWRIVTSAFLHGGLLHIAFNMYALYIFGPLLERGVGRIRFLLIYVGGMIGASAAVLAFNFGQPTLGASGAVLGLAGGMAAVLMARGQSIFKTSLGSIFLINLALPLLPGVNISFWGHFGGIAGGFVLAAILAMLPPRLGPNGAKASIGVAVLAIMVMIGAASAVAVSNGLVTVGI